MRAGEVKTGKIKKGEVEWIVTKAEWMKPVYILKGYTTDIMTETQTFKE